MRVKMIKRLLISALLLPLFAFGDIRQEIADSIKSVAYEKI